MIQKQKTDSRTLSYLMMAILIFVGSQLNAQLHRWAFAPVQVEMLFNPMVSNILEYPNQPNASAPTLGKVGNCMYDNSNGHELLFYISDNRVYDRYSSEIGNAIANAGPEACIVPFGDNGPCQKKYSIFTSVSNNFFLTINRYELDMINYTLSGPTICDQFSYQSEFGSMAVSSVINANGDRYLYSICASGSNSQAGQVRRATINNHGNTLSALVLFTPPNDAAVRCLTTELDLSPDGNFLLWASYLANITERYHLLDITNPGLPIYHPFDIPGIGGNSVNDFRGVEFVSNGGNNILYLGAGTNGIFRTNIALTAFTQVTGSNPDYGLSQIELAENGLMYASSINTANVGLINAFNPLANIPAMLGGTKAFTLMKNNVAIPCPKFTSAVANTPFPTLPDQIDGENYGLNLCTPNTQTGSTDVYAHNSGNATWSYSGNPWSVTNGAIQVIKELRIENNSHLTISNMTFKFSPGAKVIIQQGSTLTLDNGTVFTSDKIIAADSCNVNDGWQGIEVWGTANQPQSSPTNQGRLNVMHNSVIEYARCGAKNYNPAAAN